MKNGTYLVTRVVKCSKSLLLLSLIIRDSLLARRKIVEPLAQQNSYSWLRWNFLASKSSSGNLGVRCSYTAKWLIMSSESKPISLYFTFATSFLFAITFAIRRVNLQITGLGQMASFVAPLSDIRLVGTLWVISMSDKLIPQTGALKRFEQSVVVVSADSCCDLG